MERFWNGLPLTECSRCSVSILNVEDIDCGGFTVDAVVKFFVEDGYIVKWRILNLTTFGINEWFDTEEIDPHIRLIVKKYIERNSDFLEEELSERSLR